MISAFIFDLDGVLTDTAEFHFRAWSALADKLDVSFTRADNEQLKGVDRMGSLAFILDKTNRTFFDAEKQALADEKNTLYQSMLDTMQPTDIFDGVHELLDALQARNLGIALASSSKNARQVLNCLGITERFDFIVDAATITKGKPNPEIFLTAAKGLGTTPSQCVGVEDALAGLQGIMAAGMHSVGIGDTHTLADAQLVYPHISELKIDQVLALAQSS